MCNYRAINYLVRVMWRLEAMVSSPAQPPLLISLLFYAQRPTAITIHLAQAILLSQFLVQLCRSQWQHRLSARRQPLWQW